MAWLESKWVVLCLIASLAFNFGVGGTFGARIIEHHFGKTHGGTHDRLHGGTHGERRDRLFNQLKLSPEQRHRINADGERVHPHLRLVVDAMNEQRSALTELLIARRPDRSAIDAALERLKELQGERQRLIVDHLLRFSDFLDDQQREKCRGMIAELLGAKQPGG